jgi:hypothetical protein
MYNRSRSVFHLREWYIVRLQLLQCSARENAGPDEPVAKPILVSNQDESIAAEYGIDVTYQGAMIFTLALSFGITCRRLLIIPRVPNFAAEYCGAPLWSTNPAMLEVMIRQRSRSGPSVCLAK